MGKSAQRTQEVDKTPTPPPQESKGTSESNPTGLEGNPSPSPTLTAKIEADADKNSETPAVQALIEGASALIMLLTVFYCITIPGMLVTSVCPYNVHAESINWGLCSHSGGYLTPGCCKEASFGFSYSCVCTEFVQPRLHHLLLVAMSLVRGLRLRQ